MTKFSGLATAIVTPFTADGSIDLIAFDALIQQQLTAKVDAIVVCGSTGEGATISADEKCMLFERALQQSNGAISVIAGTGSNNTAETIQLTKRAQHIGVDAVLLVTPYYNKPTQDGCYAHHAAIAEACTVSQILYNVPGRTATTMSASTQLRIASDYPNVIATKEASFNLELMSEIVKGAPRTFSLIAGDDSLALPIIALGGVGCIAVISNYAPKLFGELIRHALHGNLQEARKIQALLMEAYSRNFVESNPIPVKWIMQELGNIPAAYYRLPLTPPTPQTQQVLQSFLQQNKHLA
jgi:4-hydroxy-tetrahydrodipicolinate synthase